VSTRTPAPSEEPHDAGQPVRTADPVTSVLDGPAADQPSPGSTVRLLSATGEVVTLAELESWDTGPYGLTATGYLTAATQAAEQLHGHRVWASMFTEKGTLLVMQGIVSRSRPDRPDQLELTGVIGIAREPRRAALRASLERPLRLVLDGAEHPLEVVSVDLSSSGARVRLPAGKTLAVGDSVTVEIDLEGAETVRVDGDVLRLDEEQGQAVLRFHDLTPQDESAINRSVYPALGSPPA
jgi:PilZ domain